MTLGLGLGKSAFYLAVGSCVPETPVQCALWCSEVSLCLCSLHPGDLYPFTRKPLFIIVDSSNSVAYKVRPLEAAPRVVGYSANP